MFILSIQKLEVYLKKTTIFFPFFCATFKYFTCKKKDLKKKHFIITIINIRSCAKVKENTINSLKLVYIKEKHKIWCLFFTRLIKIDGLNKKTDY